LVCGAAAEIKGLSIKISITRGTGCCLSPFSFVQETILLGVVEELVPGANVGGPCKERVRRRISGESV
jgi:hypothetical protein